MSLSADQIASISAALVSVLGAVTVMIKTLTATKAATAAKGHAVDAQTSADAAEEHSVVAQASAESAAESSRSL